MAILPSTLLGILPVGCLLYMHGTLSAETFLAVIVLSFGVMQPLITAFFLHRRHCQVTTIVGEVAEVLSGEDMQRPERAEKLPADNAIELKGCPLCLSRQGGTARNQSAHCPGDGQRIVGPLPAAESPPSPGLSPPCGM